MYLLSFPSIQKYWKFLQNNFKNKIEKKTILGKKFYGYSFCNKVATFNKLHENHEKGFFEKNPSMISRNWILYVLKILTVWVAFHTKFAITLW